MGGGELIAAMRCRRTRIDLAQTPDDPGTAAVFVSATAQRGLAGLRLGPSASVDE